MIMNVNNLENNPSPKIVEKNNTKKKKNPQFFYATKMKKSHHILSFPVHKVSFASYPATSSEFLR